MTSKHDHYDIPRKDVVQFKRVCHNFGRGKGFSSSDSAKMDDNRDLDGQFRVNTIFVGEKKKSLKQISIDTRAMYWI